MKLRVKSALAAVLAAAGCVLCTGCNPQMIAVIMAMTVPTTVGYVESSKVTSANSTAMSIRNNVNTFLTQMDTIGAGLSTDDTMCVKCVVEDNKWTIVNFNGSGSYAAPVADDWDDGMDHWNGDDHRSSFTAFMGDIFTIESAYAEIWLDGCKCVGVSFVENADYSGATPAYKDFICGYCPEFSENGIIDGEIVGTSPILYC